MKREDEEVRLQEVVRRSSAARLGRLWLAARVGCESGGAHTHRHSTNYQNKTGVTLNTHTHTHTYTQLSDYVAAKSPKPPKSPTSKWPSSPSTSEWRPSRSRGIIPRPGGCSGIVTTTITTTAKQVIKCRVHSPSTATESRTNTAS